MSRENEIYAIDNWLKNKMINFADLGITAVNDEEIFEQLVQLRAKGNATHFRYQLESKGFLSPRIYTNKIRQPSQIGSVVNIDKQRLQSLSAMVTRTLIDNCLKMFYAIDTHQQELDGNLVILRPLWNALSNYHILFQDIEYNKLHDVELSENGIVIDQLIILSKKMLSFSYEIKIEANYVYDIFNRMHQSMLTIYGIKSVTPQSMQIILNTFIKSGGIIGHWKVKVLTMLSFYMMYFVMFPTLVSNEEFVKQFDIFTDPTKIEYVFLRNLYNTCYNRMRQYDTVMGKIQNINIRTYITLFSLIHEKRMCQNRCQCVSTEYGTYLSKIRETMFGKQVSWQEVNVWKKQETMNPQRGYYGNSQGAISHVWGEKYLLNEENETLALLMPRSKLWLDIWQVREFDPIECRKEYTGNVYVMTTLAAHFK